MKKSIQGVFFPEDTPINQAYELIEGLNGEFHEMNIRFELNQCFELDHTLTDLHVFVKGYGLTVEEKDGATLSNELCEAIGQYIRGDKTSMGKIHNRSVSCQIWVHAYPREGQKLRSDELYGLCRSALYRGLDRMGTIAAKRLQPSQLYIERQDE